VAKSYEPRANAAHRPTVALGGRNICGVQVFHALPKVVIGVGVNSFLSPLPRGTLRQNT
jgi:hypothetical protein